MGCWHQDISGRSRHVRPYTPDYEQWMDYRQRLIQMQMQLNRLPALASNPS